METNGVTERNRKALQSETWKEAGKAIWAEIHLGEKLVRAYLQNGYKAPDKQCDIEVSGVTYKVLDRGEITVFYDADGNTLFDMENSKLAEEAANLEEQSELEKDANETETETETETTDKKQDEQRQQAQAYTSGEEKLLVEENEMLSSVKPEFKQIMQAQMDLIFKELIGEVRQDAEFEKKVLLNHKSMKRCMKFCADKVMGLREPSDQEKADARDRNIPIMTPIGSDMLFGWIKEYYDRDDKEEVEKEKKVAAHKTKRKPKGKKTAAEKKKTEPKECVSPKQESKAMEKKEGATSGQILKKRDKSVNGQVSMFDFMDA